MKTEKAIEIEIRQYLERKLKAYVLKQHGSGFTKPGIPDLIVCLNGCFVAIEVKKQNGVVSDQQKVHIRNINKCGGIAMVARGDNALDDVLNKLEELDII